MSVTKLFVSFDAQSEAIEFTDHMFNKYACSLWVYHRPYIDAETLEGWHVSAIEWNEAQCVYSRVSVECKTQDLFAETA